MQHLIIKRKQAVQLQILQSMRLEVAEYPCHVKTRALPLGGGGGAPAFHPKDIPFVQNNRLHNILRSKFYYPYGGVNVIMVGTKKTRTIW